MKIFIAFFCRDILLIYFFPSAFASTTTGSAKDMTFGRMVVSQCANGAKLREAVNSSPNVLTSAIFFLILNCLRVSVVFRRPVFQHNFEDHYNLHYTVQASDLHGRNAQTEYPKPNF